MSLITASAGDFPVPDFCLIFAPSMGYGEPEILHSGLNPFCRIGADPGHFVIYRMPAFRSFCRSPSEQRRGGLPWLRAEGALGVPLRAAGFRHGKLPCVLPVT